jgi:hypothetical protein
MTITPFLKTPYRAQKKPARHCRMGYHRFDAGILQFIVQAPVTDKLQLEETGNCK